MSIKRACFTGCIFLSIFALTQSARADVSLSKYTTLETIAAKVNRLTPIPIDGTIRLDGAAADRDLTFTYRYTFTNGRLTSQNERLMRSALQSETRPQVKNYVCTSSELADLRSAAKIIRFKYLDANGQFIADINIPVAECRS